MMLSAFITFYCVLSRSITTGTESASHPFSVMESTSWRIPAGRSSRALEVGRNCDTRVLNVPTNDPDRMDAQSGL